MKPLQSRADLINGWNNMDSIDGKKVIIGMVFIDTHAAPGRILLPGGAFSSLQAEKELQSKRMDGLIISGCNAGHRDFPNNVAAAFARKVECVPVIASDGTVYSQFPDHTSCADSDFYDFVKQQKSSRTDNDGWLLYQEDESGNIVVEETGTKRISVDENGIAKLEGLLAKY